MNITVTRVTPPDLWRECAEMTTGKLCKMSWFEMLKTGHSPIREQRFLIKFHDIPRFVCSHLIRHDKFANPFVLSGRTDRGGADFKNECNLLAHSLVAQCDNLKDRVVTLDLVVSNIQESIAVIEKFPERFDRYALASFAFDVNAEEIINISKARLCSMASRETRDIWCQVLDLIEEVDADLVRFCKRPCVWQGFCRERKPCGYMASSQYIYERNNFKSIFKPKV